jgi:hypothetical protein
MLAVARGAGIAAAIYLPDALVRTPDSLIG